jgi:tellurite resistance protein TerA
MMSDLVRGANAPLPQMHFDAVLRWPTAGGALDASVFLVGETGHVRNDGDMVFYNQPAAQNNCVRLLDASNGLARFSVSLPEIPDDVSRIIFCLTVDSMGRSMSDFNGMDIIFDTAGRPTHRFRPDMAGATEVAIMVAELYRRNESWKIRAVAQGFRGGLAALATSLGVDVEGENKGSAPAPLPELARTPQGPATPRLEQTRPPPEPEPDSSISGPSEPQARTAGALLLQPSERVPITSGAGRLSVSLDWRWRIGGDGRVRPVTLSLGAAYIGAGVNRGAVQVPDNRGQLEGAPWLMVVPGTARSADAGHERLLLNLDQRADFERIDIFVFIAKGAATWAGCEAWINISGPLPALLEYRIDAPADGQAAIALLRIANAAEGYSIQRLDQPGTHQADLDTKLNWGLGWRFPSAR